MIFDQMMSLNSPGDISIPLRAQLMTVQPSVWAISRPASWTLR